MEADPRALMAEKQRRWMQQRQAELDTRNACSSFGGGSGDGSAPGQAEVLERLTEQITERLQVEVRRENARLMQDGAVGAKVEALLERHIETHTCPICYELMSGKLHQPTLLFPCGHTFCAECLGMHLEKLQKKTCPACREQVSTTAPNVSLQQVIDGFVERQQSLARGDVLPELIQAAGGGDEARYADQYRAFSMRCRVMENQLAESRAERQTLGERRATAEAVREHLLREEGLAAGRLEQARIELDLLRSQLSGQCEKCEAVASREAELEQVEGIVLQTQTALDAERQKALLLVRNFNPALADALQREFEA